MALDKQYCIYGIDTSGFYFGGRVPGVCICRLESHINLKEGAQSAP